MAHDVFISYSAKDKAIADGVCATLEGRAIRCWIAPRDILPGQDWDTAIIGAIKAAKIMVLVFSSHSNDSFAVHREVKAAFSNGLIVAPLRLDDVRLNENLEFFMGLVHWLDAMTPPIEGHLTQLAESVELLLAGKSGERDAKYGRATRTTISTEQGNATQLKEKMLGRKGAVALLLTLMITMVAFWKFWVSAASSSDDSEEIAPMGTVAAEAPRRVVMPLAPATSPSPQPVSRPSAKHPEEVVRSSELAVVWIGFEINQKQFCYATAWAIKPNVIVTTAVAADQLEQIGQKAAEGDFPAVLIARDAAGFVKIREMHAHSGYKASQPAAAASIAYNIAVGVLERDLSTVCSPAMDEEIAELNVSTRLLGVGFVDESAGKEAFDKIKNLVRLEYKPVRVTGGDPTGAEWPANYQVQVGSGDAIAGRLEPLVGSPVFNEQGHVVGVLTILGNSFRMVSLKNVRGWLDGF